MLGGIYRSMPQDASTGSVSSESNSGNWSKGPWNMAEKLGGVSIDSESHPTFPDATPMGLCSTLTCSFVPFLKSGTKGGGISVTFSQGTS